jgi:site-specific recombinase XerD
MSDGKYSLEELLARAWRYCAGPPRPPSPSDDLATLVEEFVGLKRYLGERYANTEYQLRSFCRSLHEMGIHKVQELTSAALAQYLSQTPGISNQTWNRRFAAIKVFMDYLQAQGKIAQNPCALLAYKRVLPWVPYIFSHEEIRKILDRSVPEPS